MHLFTVYFLGEISNFGGETSHRNKAVTGLLKYDKFASMKQN